VELARDFEYLTIEEKSFLDYFFVR